MNCKDRAYRPYDRRDDAMQSQMSATRGRQVRYDDGGNRRVERMLHLKEGGESHRHSHRKASPLGKLSPSDEV